MRRVEAMIRVIQRTKPYRSALGIVLTYFAANGSIERTARIEGKAFEGVSSHEAALCGVLMVFAHVTNDRPLTIKVGHKTADSQLHNLADIKDRNWRGPGGTVSKHVDLLRQIVGEKEARLNVEFVSPRQRKNGPYVEAFSIASTVIDAP